MSARASNSSEKEASYKDHWIGLVQAFRTSDYKKKLWNITALNMLADIETTLHWL